MGRGEDEDPEVGPADAEAEAEATLLADAVPMLRFLLLCDIWQWRLERWSRGTGSGDGAPASSAASTQGAAGSSALVEMVDDESVLGMPLLSRPHLRERLRRFDGGLIEVGDAVAHIFASATTSEMLWRYFLYRLGDPATPEFAPKLPPHAEGAANPLEMLRPPRLKADPSLAEVAMLPRVLLKNAAARATTASVSEVPSLEPLPATR